MNTQTDYTPDAMADTFDKQRLESPLPIRLTIEQRQTIKDEAERFLCSEVAVVRLALNHYFSIPKRKRKPPAKP